ncbi:MAG: Hsp70 family protein [Lachnospiraceae bacterium]|nr:Hsp70 family protein [Lachnospiraceae bacterium]
MAAKILTHAKKFSRIRDLLSDSDVFITVPANFDTDQINNTLEAAKRAGFENVQLRPEPKAAILSFLHEEMGKREHKLLDISTRKRILVIDIGGGTCDVCIEDVWLKENGSCAFEHKAVGRDNIGGVDFDVRLADYLAAKYCSFELTKSDRAILIESAQTIKETLSTRIDYFIEDDFDGDFEAVYTASDWKDKIADAEPVSLSQNLSGGQVTFKISVEEFCNTIVPLVQNRNIGVGLNKDEGDARKNMQDLLENTLEDNSIDKDSIDVIFLTGGMSKCFILKAALYELIGKPIIVPSDPMLAVSRGAALMNKYAQEDIISHDIMPRSIMIETNSGHLKKLVSMGERVPVTKTVDEVFKTTSRTGVIIRLFEGKDEYDNQLRKLNSVYRLTYEPQEVGKEFKIEYTIDKTKRIKFTLHFLESGATYDIEAQVKKVEEA